MAYNFKKLGEVESVAEFPEGAKVLIENNGAIKRCAADGLGGGGDSGLGYVTFRFIGGNLTRVGGLTFAETYEKIMSYEPVIGFVFFQGYGYVASSGRILNLTASDWDEEIEIYLDEDVYIWNENGITKQTTGGGGDGDMPQF